MAGVVFVAPYLLEATLGFVRGAAELPGVRLGLVTQEPLEALPVELRSRLAAHWQVDDALDAEVLAGAVRGIAAPLAGVDRLFGVLEQLQVPLAEVRASLGIPGMGVEVARNFRDKSRMKDRLQAAGLPCARHRLTETAEEAREFAIATGFPMVVKPPAGAGARDTFRVDDMAQLDRYLAVMPPDRARPVLLEEFISGEEHSFDSVTVQGRPVWHSISRYFPTPLEVLQSNWIQWCVLLPRDIETPEFDDIREVAAASLRTLGLETGLTHLEWFRRGDGSIAVSEVAARPPGAQFTSLISYAHDIDLYGGWARLMAFDEFEPPQRLYSVGAAFLRGQGTGRVMAVHGLGEAQDRIGDLVVEAKLPGPGQPTSGTYEGEGHVIVRHPDTEVVAAALATIVSTIRVELG